VEEGWEPREAEGDGFDLEGKNGEEEIRLGVCSVSICYSVKIMTL
jgi:hypothetical protein